MTAKQTYKYILFILFFHFSIGIALAILLSTIRSSSHLFYLLLIATIINSALNSFLNLLFFLPMKLSYLRFILPGILSVFLVLIYFKSTVYELIICEIFSVSNLVFGIIWAQKEKLNL
jgi:hypothetical protein